MKEGKSLRDLAKEVDRRRKAKADFVAPAARLSVVVSRDNVPTLTLADPKMPRSFPLNVVAHEQMADYAGIPMPYYRKMLTDAPDLIAANVNRWLRDKAEGERRLVRTMDGKVRALLSDKYRALENEDLAEAVLPVLKDRNLDILACDITDQRLYIKAVDREMRKDIPTGKKMGDGTHTFFDTCSAAVTVSNSEVGRGSVLVESGVWTKVCTNMCSFGANMRKFHTGTRAELSDEVFAVLSDKTKKMTDAAVWGQVRDLVIAAFDQARFDAIAEKLAKASEDKIPKKTDIPEVIEVIGKHFGLGEPERRGVLAHLIEDGDLSRYGVHSAVTRFSADVADFDRATELERTGGRIIELGATEWERFLKAA